MDSSNSELELYRQHRAGLEKYTYFLLAAAASGIALVVKSTTDAVLSWSLVPLAAAVLAWGASFYFGCRYAQLGHGIMRKNAGLIQARRGAHPIAKTPAENMALAQIANDDIERDMTTSGKYARYQFHLLVAGAVLYVAWHVLGIILRS